MGALNAKLGLRANTSISGCVRLITSFLVNIFIVFSISCTFEVTKEVGDRNRNQWPFSQSTKHCYKKKPIKVETWHSPVLEIQKETKNVPDSPSIFVDFWRKADGGSQEHSPVQVKKQTKKVPETPSIFVDFWRKADGGQR